MAIATYAAPGTMETPRVRKLGLEDLRIALRQGWADYLHRRGEIVMLGMIYPVVGLIACLSAFERNLLPLLFPLVAGISLMGPPLASGFYELARRRELGEDARWTHAFDLFGDRRIWPLATLTAFVAALFFAWLGVAWAIYSMTMGADPTATADTFLPRLFTTSAGWEMILAGDLAGLVFAVAVLAVSAVSFPMLVDGGVGPLTAAETSLRAVAANPRVFATWGLVIVALLVIGSVPLFVGLALVLPTVGYATWHLYRRAVEA